MLLCPVSKVVNSGNIGIFCVSLFSTDGNELVDRLAKEAAVEDGPVV